MIRLTRARFFLLFSMLPIIASGIAHEGKVSFDKHTKVKIATATGHAPSLLVNGVSVAPVMLFVNLHDVSDPEHTVIQLGEVRDASTRNINIISLTVGMPWNGSEKEFQDYIDRHFDALIAINPKVLLVPRLNPGAPPRDWAKNNPDEITQYQNPSFKARHGSPSSRKWRSLAAAALERTVEHIEKKYSKNVLGYHICGQKSEWFYALYWRHGIAGFEPCAIAPFRAFLRTRYQTNAELQRAWNDATASLDKAMPPALAERSDASRRPSFSPSRRLVDFSEFQCVEMADALLELCAAVKRKAPNKLTFAFYGYHFELPHGFNGPHSCGHFAMERVLASSAVDVICAPASYFDRKAGGGGYFPAAIDSVMLHNKLWLIEDDVRTHLDPLLAKGEDHEWNPRMADMAETRGVLIRDFAAALIHGTAIWWMDLWGRGWFAGREMWDDLGKLNAIYQRHLIPARQFSPDIAVIVDDRSLLELSTAREVPLALLSAFRTQLYRIGASTGYYYLSDLLAGKIPPAKFYIMLDLFRLDDASIAAIGKRMAENNASVLWMWAPGSIRQGFFDPLGAEKTVGLKLQRISCGGGKIVTADGNGFDAGHPILSPSFAVNDTQAVPLARYADGSGIAVAMKKSANHFTAYSGTLKLPSSLLRQLAREAGVHIYLDTNDVVMAGRGLLSIHASSAGDKKIVLPQQGTLVNLLNGETLTGIKMKILSMKKGETVLFQLGQ